MFAVIATFKTVFLLKIMFYSWLVFKILQVNPFNIYFNLVQTILHEETVILGIFFEPIYYWVTR